MTGFEEINRITSPYGPRVLNGKWETHRGIDLVPTTRPGQSVPAAAWNIREVTGGTVLRIAYDKSRGNYIDVQTAIGIFERYQHLAKTFVHVGQKVPQGAVLGVAGSTGNSTGAHLHFGVYRGGSAEKNAIDPAPWLGLPNKTGTYQGNNTLDNPAAQEKPKLYNVTALGASKGDCDSLLQYAKSLALDARVEEV